MFDELIEEFIFDQICLTKYDRLFFEHEYEFDDYGPYVDELAIIQNEACFLKKKNLLNLLLSTISVSRRSEPEEFQSVGSD